MTEPQRTPDEVIFVVTLSDLAALTGYEFDRLWGALGVIALARGKAIRTDRMGERPPRPDASPVEDTPSRVDRGAEEPVAESSRVIQPQTPNLDDEMLFAVIRANPSISMAAAERAVGMAQSRGIQRMKLLDGYGTLPADIKEWREARGQMRGVPKGVHSQSVRTEVNPRRPAPETIQDALAVRSFDERRKESARAASERTWRERHPESVQNA